MPNRIIKESICTSEKISKLTDFQFRLWIGLIVQADDLGRFDARPAILKGHIFPLRENVTTKSLDDALHALSTLSCLSLYEVGGKLYGKLTGWTDHQRVRDVKSRFPAPPWENETEDLSSENAKNNNPRQTAATCGDLRQTAATCGDLRQTAATCGLNPNPNPNTNTNPLSLSIHPASSNNNNLPCAYAYDVGDGGTESEKEIPTLGDVQAYFAQNRYCSSPEEFFITLSGQKWHAKDGKPVRRWQAVADSWEKFALKAKKAQQEDKSFDTDEFFALALKRSMGRLGAKKAAEKGGDQE